MRDNLHAKQHKKVVKLPNGRKISLLVDPQLKQRPAPKYDPHKSTMQQWFQTKFYEDLSDIRRENQGYYKHYVHHFVTNFFDKQKITGKRVLDFGCGPGFYSAILARRGANVVGIDHSDFLIQKANEHKARLKLSNVQFIRGDLVLSSGKWTPACFDYVIAIDTIVSFDYASARHKHEEVVSAFRCVSRVLKPAGRFYIIESHPCFGQAIQEIMSVAGEPFCVRPPGYKIEHKPKDYPHHWFTLDEMTQATNEAGMAVLRIHEPDPSPALKQDNAGAYSFRLKYPGMIVYEICRADVPPSQQ
jgi:SAM-dependent methyltransferase